MVISDKGMTQDPSNGTVEGDGPRQRGEEQQLGFDIVRLTNCHETANNEK